MTGSRSGRGRGLWLIFGTALLTRLLVLWVAITSYPHQWLFSRGIEMGLLADSLVHGLGYSSPFGGTTGPTAFIAPGYPTLIAGIFLLFGSYTFASAIAIMLLQIGLSLVTIWLMMKLAWEALDERTAMLAGAFWAISLPLLWIPTIFWETSISACVLPGMLLLALRMERAPTLRGWVGLGVCAGLAGLVNPALLPALLLVMGWVAWQTRLRLRAGLAVGLVALAVVYAAWPIRNAERFHAFIPTRSTVGFELWMGNRPGATGFLDESLVPLYNKQELASFVAKGELAYTQGKSDEAKRYVAAHPGVFVRMTLRRIVRFWTGTGNLHGSAVYASHATLTSVLGFAGLALLYRQRRRGFATLMLLPLLAFPLPYYITHAEFRYRLNIDPLMTVLAAYSVTQVVGRMRRAEDAAVE